jgi:hypothetical protein
MLAVHPTGTKQARQNADPQAVAERGLYTAVAMRP